MLSCLRQALRLKKKRDATTEGPAPGPPPKSRQDVNEAIIIEMIHHMYPPHVASAIINNELDSLKPNHHRNVTVCFADIKGFTDICSAAPPIAVMRFLNQLFGQFDALLDVHGVVKLETVGDCYVSCTGLYEEDGRQGQDKCQDKCQDAAERMVRFAADMVYATARLARLPELPGYPVQLRVGIHSGDVVSGVIDTYQPKFCLFGDTMNVASRMETTSIPMHVHVSAATFRLLGPATQRLFVPRETYVKGKGILSTYLLVTSKGYLESPLSSRANSSSSRGKLTNKNSNTSGSGSNSLDKLGVTPRASSHSYIARMMQLAERERPDQDSPSCTPRSPLFKVEKIDTDTDPIHKI